MTKNVPERLARLGKAVERERIQRGWTKEAAAKAAGISSITWKRVEDGLPIQATKRYSIEEAFGWGFGSLDNLERGRDPIVEPDPASSSSRQRTLFPHAGDDEEFTQLFVSTTRFAVRCREYGADASLVDDFIHDAVVLLDSTSRANDQHKRKRSHEEAQQEPIQSQGSAAGSSTSRTGAPIDSAMEALVAITDDETLTTSQRNRKISALMEQLSAADGTHSITDGDDVRVGT